MTQTEINEKKSSKAFVSALLIGLKVNLSGMSGDEKDLPAIPPVKVLVALSAVLRERGADFGENIGNRSCHFLHASNCGQGDETGEQSVFNQVLTMLAVGENLKPTHQSQNHLVQLYVSGAVTSNLAGPPIVKITCDSQADIKVDLDGERTGAWNMPAYLSREGSVVLMRLRAGN